MTLLQDVLLGEIFHRGQWLFSKSTRHYVMAAALFGCRYRPPPVPDDQDLIKYLLAVMMALSQRH